MELYDLKTLHMKNPLGIDRCPYFSWKMKSDERDIMQTAYRIVVSDRDGVAWDTGKREWDESTYVEYTGNELKSKTRYNWEVTVWTNKCNEVKASAVFETALLQKADWVAGWAESKLPRRKSKAGFGNQPPATMFRKTFGIERPIKQARLYVTCHGIYRLTINGKAPDDREFAPEHTSYGKYLCYQTYDVTELLHQGSNVIGMYVGDGWYCGPTTKPNIKNLKQVPAVLFQLETEDINGVSRIICSDGNVRTAYGPVLFSDLFSGEMYDASKELQGWDTPDFTEGNEWKNAQICDYGYANLTAQLGEPVKRVRQLQAQRMYRSPKGETIIDFGQILCGRVAALIHETKGTKVELDYFEETDKNGNFFETISADGKEGRVAQRDVFVSNGKEQLYEPLFTFHGFRYVRLIGFTDPKPEDFMAVALSTEMENVGTFECSDVRLNRLYENTRWSQQSNMLSIPTDCPQREKAGWTGDIQVYATTALHNADATLFLTRWLENLACDQGENGAVPMVVPYVGFYPLINRIAGLVYGNKGRGKEITGQAGWGDAAVLVPYFMYKATGNTSILRQQYDSMKKWCGYVISTAENQRGKNKLPKEIDRYLWNTGFHWGECKIPSYTKEGTLAGELPTLTICRSYIPPFFAWYSVTSMAEIASLLERDEDAAYYSDMADRMKDAFQRGVIDENGNMPVELMGAYVLPIAFDLVPEKHKRHFEDKLVSMIEKNDFCMDTGFLTTPYLLDALCKIGRRDLAYTILYQDKCPSWLYEVKMGATSIWENWTTYHPDGTPMLTSFNHYAFGCVDDWIFRTICGIDKSLPGYKHIIMKPQPDDSLSFAKRSFESEYGTIVSSWEKKDGMFYLDITIPCNTSADVILPNGNAYSVGSGHYHFKSTL